MQYEIVDLPVSNVINEHSDFFDAYVEWALQHESLDDVNPNCLEVRLPNSPKVYNLNLYTLGHLSTEFFNPVRMSKQSPIQYLSNTYALDEAMLRAENYTIAVDAKANIVRLIVDYLNITYTLENFNTLQRLFLARIVTAYGVKGGDTMPLKVNHLSSYIYKHSATHAEFSPLEDE